MKLTVVIATADRPILCRKVLKSLAKQIGEQEILLIDNGKVKLPRETYKAANLRYFYTSIKGLAHARNLGWQKAHGDYIAYLDDDAIATHAWVQNILKFIKLHPDVIAFGGPYASSNKDLLPTWIPRELTTMKIVTKVARPIVLPHEWLTGTNMIFRRSILEEHGGFNESLGVTSTRRSYGEETDLLIRVHNAGYAIWYDPEIRVLHEFAQSKASLSFLIRDQFIHGYNSLDTFKNLAKSDPGGTANTAFSRLSRANLDLKARLYFLLSPLAYLTGILIGKISSTLR